MRERAEERVAVPGWTSWRECAVERGMAPAQTPEESMEMGKRAPSSLLRRKLEWVFWFDGVEGDQGGWLEVRGLDGL
jgi:hypothetical protein